MTGPITQLSIHYINLDDAADRRARLEANIRATAPPGQSARRFPARTPATAGALPGAIAPREKACFDSHRALLAAAPDDGRHLMVLEDDAELRPDSFALIADALGKLDPPGWDLLYTDLAIAEPVEMARFAKLHQRAAAARRVVFVRLEKVAFYAGSTAYIVNRRSRARLSALLDIPALDRPYDLFLRDLVHRGDLRAVLLFPFVTTIGPHADLSAVQGDRFARTDLIYNTFRRMLAMGGAPPGTAATVADIARDLDPRLVQMTTLIAATLDRSFDLK